MKLEFAVTLFSLTAFFGLILVLVGSGLLNEARQRQLSYGTVGLGFLLVYPIVTVLVVWIAPSWTFGILCAATVGLWLRLVLRRRARIVRLLALSMRHALTVAAVAVLFWLPGMVGSTNGLFTEAGGDFTIYAGLPSKVGDRPLWTVSSEEIGPFRLKPLAIRTGGGALLSPKSDPPSAGWSMNRIVELGWGTRNPGWYSLQHMLFRVSWGAQALQYLAVLAVVWAVLVLSLQRLVHLRYGRLAGLVALLVLAGSHALAAVGYDHYLPQLLAMTLTATAAFLLALPEAAALPRAARVGVAALCIAFVGVAYYPLLPAAVLPVILLVGMWHSAARSRTTLAGWLRELGLVRNALLALGAVYFVANVVVLYWAEAAGISSMLSRFLFRSTAQEVAADISALGRARPYHLSWLDALLGGFSLQMIPPYSTSNPAKSAAAVLLAIAGLMLALGFVYVLALSWSRAWRSTRGALSSLGRTLSDEARFRAAFTSAFGLFMAVELVLGRRYEYTQFKALAYVLPFTLLVGVLAGTWLLTSSRLVYGVYGGIAIALLIGTLAFFRVDGATRIAEQRDRAAVLSQNVPDLAAEIRAHDPRAFVLAFPSHPSEYSLWEFGLRNTRGLIMRYYVYPEPHESYVRVADVPHLWVLQDAPDPVRRPESLTQGTVNAYPATASGCSVRAAVLHADGMSTVAFGPLDGATPMWLDSDVDYWIFDPEHVSKLEVLVKEHQALHGRSIAAQLIYPESRTLALPVAKLDNRDALAFVSTDALPRSDLVVVRISGTGYSDVRCG